VPPSFFFSKRAAPHQDVELVTRGFRAGFYSGYQLCADPFRTPGSRPPGPGPVLGSPPRNRGSLVAHSRLPMVLNSH
jgi:hypothetical protein